VYVHICYHLIEAQSLCLLLNLRLNTQIRSYVLDSRCQGQKCCPVALNTRKTCRDTRKNPSQASGVALRYDSHALSIYNLIDFMYFTASSSFQHQQIHFIRGKHFHPSRYIMIQTILAAVATATLVAASQAAEYDYVIVGSGPGGGSLA
jgi:hypothetical protein